MEDLYNDYSIRQAFAIQNACDLLQSLMVPSFLALHS